jgi:hypothetical protein
MDVFAKKSGDYWVMLAVDAAEDGTFDWHLRLLTSNSSRGKGWVAAVGTGFEDVSAASADGMEALCFLDSIPSPVSGYPNRTAEPRDTLLFH